jgi:ESX secretion-associated protein EspG
MTTGRQAEWRMSAVEFDVLWREFGRGLPPYPLDLPSPGTTYGERAQVVAEIWAQLARRGLVDGGPRRRLPADIDDALSVLAKGRIVIDGIIDLGDQVCLLAAKDGARAALVLQREDDIQLLATMDAALLSGRLVELLPSAPPAHGQPVSLPYQLLTDVLGKLASGDIDSTEFERLLRVAGVSGRDVRWIAGLAQGDQSHAVQFGINIEGNRVGVLSWYATEQGGVLVTRQKAPDGDWVTITPSDPVRVVSRLDELAGSRRR